MASNSNPKRGHRRAKTAGVGQLEAFDALSLQKDAYDTDFEPFADMSSSAQLFPDEDTRPSMQRVSLGRRDEALISKMLGQLMAGEDKNVAVGNLGLETSNSAWTEGQQPAFEKRASMLASVGAHDDENPDLYTQRSALSHKPSFRKSLNTRESQRLLQVEDLMVRERLRDMAANGEAKQFVHIIEAWETLSVSENGDMVTEEFIEAMDSILVVIDALGGALSLIKQDWKSQMAKVRASCIRHGVVTLYRMIECENAKGEGTDCLIWMKRSLQFVEVMMSNFVAGETLAESIDVAYKRTLHDAHPWVVRVVAGKIRFAVPPDDVFLDRLYKEDRMLVKKAIRLFLCVMRPKLFYLVKHYNDNMIEKVQACRVLPEVAVMA
eukprot:CAMPEP_0184698550 /NCGR_PEP_ID=MMETSP0313-20130426/5142_1 /TAXON_ID=2792 /ORGANISM="Porphyridium aerugineum, Strain SAG 1380-2" /LENGTH=379 /DNA_ID=CAMNT_0027157513 /DNA_START=146 /DNA_END=1285 /DNA_ORIENTATION=+